MLFIRWWKFVFLQCSSESSLWHLFLEKIHGVLHQVLNIWFNCINQLTLVFSWMMISGLNVFLKRCKILIHVPGDWIFLQTASHVQRLRNGLMPIFRMWMVLVDITVGYFSLQTSGWGVIVSIFSVLPLEQAVWQARWLIQCNSSWD